MCICVDCRWVDRCKAYYKVEKQHGVEHLNLHPDFEPKEPIIHVSLLEEVTHPPTSHRSKRCECQPPRCAPLS